MQRKVEMEGENSRNPGSTNTPQGRPLNRILLACKGVGRDFQAKNLTFPFEATLSPDVYREGSPRRETLQRIEQPLAGRGAVGKEQPRNKPYSLFISSRSGGWKKSSAGRISLVFFFFFFFLYTGAYHYCHDCTAISIYRNLTHCYYADPPAAPASGVPSKCLLLLYFILLSVWLRICIQRRDVKLTMAGSRKWRISRDAKLAKVQRMPRRGRRMVGGADTERKKK